MARAVHGGVKNKLGRQCGLRATVASPPPTPSRRTGLSGQIPYEQGKSRGNHRFPTIRQEKAAENCMQYPLVTDRFATKRNRELNSPDRERPLPDQGMKSRLRRTRRFFGAGGSHGAGVSDLSVSTRVKTIGEHCHVRVLRLSTAPLGCGPGVSISMTWRIRRRAKSVPKRLFLFRATIRLKAFAPAAFWPNDEVSKAADWMAQAIVANQG